MLIKCVGLVDNVLSDRVTIVSLLIFITKNEECKTMTHLKLVYFDSYTTGKCSGVKVS